MRAATATEHGQSFWLYVVELAGTSTPNIVRIQDPSGMAKNFTFDQGWRCAAADKPIDNE